MSELLGVLYVICGLLGAIIALILLRNVNIGGDYKTDFYTQHERRWNQILKELDKSQEYDKEDGKKEEGK